MRPADRVRRYTPAPLSVALCGTERAALDVIATALTEQGATVVRPQSKGAMGDAKARRVIAHAFAGSARIDAVVVCPALPAARQRRRGEADFTATIDTALKSTFFLAKHALVQLGHGGGGALIVVLPPLAADAGVAGRVAADALECMVDALAKAAPSGVRVGSVDGAASADRIAAAVGLLIARRSKGPFRAVLRG